MNDLLHTRNCWLYFHLFVAIFAILFVFFLFLLSISSVILFPPLNSYRRYQIHRVCEDFPDLGTVSVSQGRDRRVIVYPHSEIVCSRPASAFSGSTNFTPSPNSKLHK